MEDWIKRTEKLISEYYQKGKADREYLKKKLQAFTSDDDKYVVYFGCGVQGQTIYQQLIEYGIKPSFYCDNNSNLYGKEIVPGTGIKCISIDELSKINNNTIVLLTVGLSYANQIYEQLDTIGIKQIIKYPLDSLSINSREIYDYSEDIILKQFKELYSALEDDASCKVAYYKLKAMLLPLKEMNNFTFKEIYTEPQYYPEDIITLDKDEVIVEGGSYTGDSIDYLINNIKYTDFDKYYCFELDVENFRALEEYVEKLNYGLRNKFILYNAGLSDKNGNFYYEPIGEGSSLTAGEESTLSKKCEVVSLDESLGTEYVSFIKMDIEGSEIDALNGSKGIICKQRPKLAICVYHKANHLWEIPLLIKKLVPQYKLYLRHHTLITTDTVCYANL